jgi:hypothetical protein
MGKYSGIGTAHENIQLEKPQQCVSLYSHWSLPSPVGDKFSMKWGFESVQLDSNYSTWSVRKPRVRRRQMPRRLRRLRARWR